MIELTDFKISLLLSISIILLIIILLRNINYFKKNKSQKEIYSISVIATVLSVYIHPQYLCECGKKQFITEIIFTIICFLLVYFVSSGTKKLLKKMST